MNKEKLIELGMAEDLAEQTILQIQAEIEERVSKEIEDVIAKRQKEQPKELPLGTDETDVANNQVEPQSETNAVLEELKTAHAKEIQELKLSHILEKAVRDSGAYHVDAVKPFLNMEAIEVSSDGTPQGLKEQLQALKNNTETKFLFRDGKAFQVKGAKFGESDGASEKAFDMANATYSETLKFLEENPDAKL